MPYNNNPKSVALTIPKDENTQDYRNANPGQWFYGVVDTETGQLYVVPGDVHDDPNNAEQKNARMLNTYASKPAIPAGGWTSLTDPQEKQNGIGSDPTGHMSVLRLYSMGARAANFLGFRMIKINDTFASFSDRSNSLNGDKVDQRVVTTVAGPGGWNASSTARMPEPWRDAVVTYLKGRFGIQNCAIDH